MDAFEFTILFECDTLGHLSYSEANLQHKRDVLTARLPGGEMAYYNRAIMGIKFIPAGDEEAVRGLEDSIEHAKYLEHTHVSEEVARKISESQSTTGTVEWFHRERGFFEATVYEICRDYPEVNPGTLRWVALGNRYSHKGFVLAYEYRKTGKEPKTVPHYSTDPLTVTHPEHGIRTGRKSELARDIGIDRRRLHELSKGERDEYKGWRIY